MKLFSQNLGFKTARMITVPSPRPQHPVRAAFKTATLPWISSNRCGWLNVQARRVLLSRIKGPGGIHHPFKSWWLSILLGLWAQSQLHAQTTEIHSFTNLNLPVPDGSAAGISDRQSVTSAIVTISDLRVQMLVTGEFNGDLYAYLRHTQDGVTNFCVLLNRAGRTALDSNGYDDSGLTVTFDDAAPNGDIHSYRLVSVPALGVPLMGTWQPDGRRTDPGMVLNTSARTTMLGSFQGANANGEWTLFLADLESGGTNMLVSWGLEIEGPVQPPVTWPNPADIVYGTPLGPAQLNASSSVAGTFSYNPASSTFLNAGTAQVLSVTFTPDDPLGYVTVTTHVNLNVLQAPLTIAAVNTNKIYGAALPPLRATYSGFVNGDTTNQLSSQATLTTTAAAASPVGTYPITVSGAANSNYAISFVEGTLTVTPATLTVLAVNSAKVYGASLPILRVNYSGFANGDTTNQLTSQATASTTATAASPVGVYPVSVSGTASPNYIVSHVGGTLTVTKAPLTVMALNTNKIYGTPLPSFKATYNGFVNGDTTNQLSSQATLTTTATAGSPVGSYPIIVAGAANANYSIAFQSGQLTITKASTAGIVTTSSHPSLPGTGVTFTMTVNAVMPGAGVPTGTVQFVIDGVNSGSAVVLSGGVANRTLSSLAVGTHSVLAEYSGDGNFTGTTNVLSPDQLVNTPPVAGSDTIERWPTNGTKVLISILLGNDSDTDGDVISLLSVAAASAGGGSITRDGDWIYYVPAAGDTNDDSFTYAIEDTRGATAVGTVVVMVRDDAVPSPSLIVTDLGSGSFRIRFDGIPGKSYRIEYAKDLDNPVWVELGAATADPFGLAQYVDTPPAGSPQRYYRSVYP
jgi:subtilisin-like proprotein convertase family protein